MTAGSDEPPAAPAGASAGLASASATRADSGTADGATAYVALGSNLGDSFAELRAAASWLSGICRELRRSSLYRTRPVGGPPGQPYYLNAVVALEAPGFGARRLLHELLAYEQTRGRQRLERWGPRTIDLDLLAFDRQMVDDPLLSLPHPRLHQREFVLAPLCELAPEWVHPDIGESACTLLDRLLRQVAAPQGSPPPSRNDRQALLASVGVERLDSWARGD